MPSDLWTRRVHQVMDHVRDRPAEIHTLEALAAVAHSSPFHFHRIFRAVAGETVGSFVQRARLERAAYLMKSKPGRSLTSIALDTGFATSQEFSRTFRRNYGIAPSRWNRRSRLAAPEGRAEHRSSPPVEAEARVVDHDPMRLAYTRIRPAFHQPALSAGFEQLVRSLDDRGVPWQDAQVVGMSWDNYETTPMDRLSYDLCVEVPDAVEAAGPFGIHELGAFQAVEVECDGPLQSIADAWDYLYETWFPQSDFEPADLPALKWFARPAAEMRWDAWQVACSIPLKR